MVGAHPGFAKLIFAETTGYDHSMQTTAIPRVHIEYNSATSSHYMGILDTPSLDLSA